MDTIEIKTIKLDTLIGVHRWEQMTPQTLWVDVIFGINTAHQSDVLSDTIDYDQVIEHIKHFATAHHFQLLEAFANTLAKTLLATFPMPWLKLSVHKPFANLSAKNITLTIERQQVSS